jgi:hypothetical protein
VVLSRDLIASTETGRMGALVANLDERRTHSILRLAPRATSLLNELEEMLRRNFQSVLDAQRKHGNRITPETYYGNRRQAGPSVRKLQIGVKS